MKDWFLSPSSQVTSGTLCCGSEGPHWVQAIWSLVCGGPLLVVEPGAAGALLARCCPLLELLLQAVS